MYVCNCPDSLILHTICKHIHLVQRSQPQDSNGVTSTSETTDGGKEEETDSYMYDLEEVQRLKCFAQTPNQVDVVNIRNRVTRRIADLLNLASQSNNPSNLTQLEKQINSAYSLFLCVEEKSLAPQKIKMSDNAPANKNMEKQLRFFSTKRKHDRGEKVQFAKPTREEKEQFLGDYKKNSKSRECQHTPQRHAMPKHHYYMIYCIY